MSNTHNKKSDLLYDKLDQLLEKYYPSILDYNLLDSINIDLNHNSPVIKTIINFNTKGYEYVSPNIYELLGITSEALIESGLVVGTGLINQAHRGIFINQLLPIVFSVVEDLINIRKDVKRCEIIYNIALQHKSGKLYHSIHVMKPITIGPSGFPLLAKKYIFCFPIEEIRNPNLAVQYKDEKGNWEHIYKQEFYPDTINTSKLSKREKLIYHLVKNRLSSREIAEKLSLSIFTVQNHRKNILRKCNVKSIFDL